MQKTAARNEHTQRFGRPVCPIVGVLTLLMSAGAGLAEDPSWYVRKATWRETLIASRTNLLRAEAESAQKSGSAARPILGPWYVLGPVDLPPTVDPWVAATLDVTFALDKSFPIGRGGASLRWQQRPDLTDGWVHALSEGRQVLYLRRSIDAAAAGTFTAHVDTIGEMAVWLNGRQLTKPRRGTIGYNVWSPDVAARPVALPLPLAAGRNELVLKIALRPGPRPRDDVDPWRKATLEARRPWGTVFTGYSVETGPAVEYEKIVFGEVAHLYFSTSAALGPVADPAREQLWKLLERDFTAPAAREALVREREAGVYRHDWPAGDFAELGRRYACLIGDPTARAAALRLADKCNSAADLAPLVRACERDGLLDHGRRFLADEKRYQTVLHQVASLRLAIADLAETFKSRYPQGAEFLAELAALERQLTEARAAGDVAASADAVGKLASLRQRALTANPLLDFEQLLLVRRRATQFRPSLPFNWASNVSLSATGFDNEIAVLSPVAAAGTLKTLYRPQGEQFVGDVDLHFDADRLLFSMPDRYDAWQVNEIKLDGSGFRQVTRGEADVHSYDACYLPDGGIAFCSTACFAGVPCVRGRDYVAVIYRCDADGSNVRQLCFEQDQDWCPTVMRDGRILYTRWEYTDTPHFFSRILFTMNPDGTEQREHYGSNSYWPNGIFYARPVPNHPTRIIGIVSGHHAARRSGELVLFDPALGRREASGVVQRLPGRGQKVEPVINDRLVAGTWPRFLHPYPLSDKYFLVACKTDEATPWAIYLADVFDNLLPLRLEEGFDLTEPVPVKRQPRPPIIRHQVDPKAKDAVVSIADIYTGPGLAGVPRGTVKKLRLVSYHYAFQNMAEDSQAIGVHASWDTVKVVLGTVPVSPDGSVSFRAPANTPFSIQPLDAKNRALQLMRSWLVAMPGEHLSCIGCHESRGSTPPPGRRLAVGRTPVEIEPWYGPARGFSFAREVQPVLDKYCVSCHNDAGAPKGIVALRGVKGNDPRGFSPAYLELHRYVRRPGAETDYHLLPAGEFHATTSDLVAMLEKGHYGVELDDEAWDRLATWIDLNVPFHGTWQEAQGIDRVGEQREKRRRLRAKYAGIDEDFETIRAGLSKPATPAAPRPLPEPPPNVTVAGWPLGASKARELQQAHQPATRTIDLDGGVTMRLTWIPAGTFVMGAPGRHDLPPTAVTIDEPFWMGVCEVSNEQFARFDPRHDSRYVQTPGISSTRGYAINLPQQPAVRLSWLQALEFCRWLSAQTGTKFTLPTEAQWEYACRAGSATPFWYGDADVDFAPFANLGDRNLEHIRDYSHNSKLAWMPRDDRFDDGAIVSAPVGSYRPNAWGLFDMIGNVSEWTLSNDHARASATSADPARGDPNTLKVVRGGSWHDRPVRASSAERRAYPAWMPVHDVGFRVVAPARAAR